MMVLQQWCQGVQARIQFSDWFVDENRLASKEETIIEIPRLCKWQTG